MTSETEKKDRVFAMIIAILIPLFVGGFSALLTGADMDVYDTMTRPFLAPPSWLFPIAWTILYVLMGISSYFVYVSDADPIKKRRALMFYIAQLVMNLFWSTLFFTYAQYLISLIWLLIMWVLIIICTIKFYKIRRAAGIMMCVLLLWTTFAAYLNLSYYLQTL